MTQPNAISDLEYALSVVARAVGRVPAERAAGHAEAVSWIQQCDSLPDPVLVRFIRGIEGEAAPDSGIIRDFQLAAACALLDRATRRPSVRT